MKTINDYATLYYKEHVESEPLDQDVPIECFIEGSKLAIEFCYWKMKALYDKKYYQKEISLEFQIFLNEYYEIYEKEITI